MSSGSIVRIVVLLVIALALVSGWFVVSSETFQLWREKAGRMVSDVLGRGEEAAGGEQAYYTCPMHPQIRLPAPGECPICGMTLVKKTGGEEGGPAGSIWLTDRQLQLSGVRFGEARRRPLFREIDTFGKIDYDERRVAYVSAWVGGRIDELHVDFTGLTVQKGHELVSLYSPELISAQREYLIGLRAQDRVAGAAAATTAGLVDAGRQKLLWLGLTEEQVLKIETSGKIDSHVTIHAPIGGTVIHKNVYQGQYVKAGDDLLRIADLSRVWLFADLYEHQIAPVLKRRHEDYWTCPMHHEVRREQAGDCPICQMPLMRANPNIDLRISTQAYPGEEFSGSISFIDPYLQPNTRTIRVRADIDNPDLKLRPEMYARARFHVEVGELLSIPESAVLRSGTRDVALRDRGEGRIEPVAVELGLQWLRSSAPATDAVSLPFSRSPDRYHEVLAGLQEGDRIVTSAGFLIGSEAQLQGAFEKMGRESESMKDARETPPAAETPATGVMPAGSDHAGSHSDHSGHSTNPRRTPATEIRK